jgi:hypothetical protein
LRQLRVQRRVACHPHVVMKGSTASIELIERADSFSNQHMCAGTPPRRGSADEGGAPDEIVCARGATIRGKTKFPQRYSTNN